VWFNLVLKSLNIFHENMISNSTFKAPEKNFNLYLQGTLLFNGIFTPHKEGCFKKKKMPPHAGIWLFKLPHHFFFFFFFFHIHWVSQEKKVKIKILPGCFTWGIGIALGMKCCWSKGVQTQCSKGILPYP
jgi:hypothetical protein